MMEMIEACKYIYLLFSCFQRRRFHRHALRVELVAVVCQQYGRGFVAVQSERSDEKQRAVAFLLGYK